MGMNHLVFLDTGARELEKILSRVKTMLVKEIDPAGGTATPVSPGDSLYFLRDDHECDLRVKASVVRVLPCMDGPEEELSQTLKALQPRLQLTEDQFNYWSAKKQVLLVEFECAQKIGVIHIPPDKIAAQPDWIAFEEFSLITEEGVFP
jgi:hypothetical protein